MFGDTLSLLLSFSNFFICPRYELMPVMLLINVDLKDGSCNGATGPRYEVPEMLLINVDWKDGSFNGAMGPRYEVPEMLLINVDWKDGSCNGAMGPQVPYISHQVDDTRDDSVLCYLIPSF